MSISRRLLGLVTFIGAVVCAVCAVAWAGLCGLAVFYPKMMSAWDAALYFGISLVLAVGLYIACAKIVPPTRKRDGPSGGPFPSP